MIYMKKCKREQGPRLWFALCIAYLPDLCHIIPPGSSGVLREIESDDEAAVDIKESGHA